MGQEKLILDHIEMNNGTDQVDFWDRRSCIIVKTRQILGLNKVIFGTGEVNFGS